MVKRFRCGENLSCDRDYGSASDSAKAARFLADKDSRRTAGVVLSEPNEFTQCHQATVSVVFLPMTLPGKWVIAPPRKALVVGVADMVASNDSSAEIVTYSLGSCLGIAIYDPTKKVGGLLHIMLPDSKIDAAKAASSPFMFVDSGVPRLFQAVCNFGAERHRLVIKVAGGAQLLDPQRVFNIGERNFQVFSDLLGRNGYRIHTSDVGGMASRTMRMDLTDGKVSIKSPGVDLYYL